MISLKIHDWSKASSLGSTTSTILRILTNGEPRPHVANAVAADTVVVDATFGNSVIGNIEVRNRRKILIIKVQK